jgi:S1-C subfamily serine protease
MNSRMLLTSVLTGFLLATVHMISQTTPQRAGTGAQANLATDAHAQAAIEANTNVMRSTFKIQGNKQMGSGFILGRPYTQAGRERYRYVLVTAAHVFSGNDGDFVKIWFRRQMPGGGWEQLPMDLRIRTGVTPLWKQHPEADVAAIYIAVPDGVLAGDGISTERLADDAALKSYGIHPGDEVTCDGFPLFAEGPFGFPILRAGRIASYPILPTADTKTLLLDFPVFPGNSGGPAYIAYGIRADANGILISYSPDTLAIVGLVSKERIFAERIPLGIAEIVHATLISETIAQLPPPKQQ